MTGQRPGAELTRAPLVLVTSRSFSSGRLDLIDRLHRAGLRVVRQGPDHALAELLPDLSLASAWIAGTGAVTAEHLDQAPHLRVVARYGVGTDAVDLVAAQQRGITVTNTPGANSGAVAELAIALSMAVLRGLTDGDRRVRSGDWSVTRGRQIRGTTAAVVGFGRIGRQVALTFAALGARVLVHDPYVAAADITAAGHHPVGLTTIREQADLVSLHLPGTAVVIDSTWVSACRPGQVVINTARAAALDEAAVAGAIREGRLGGAGLDTLRSEPGARSDGAGGTTSPLLAPDLAASVVVSPHLGAQTVEAIDAMGSMATDDVLAALTDQPVRYPVHPAPEGVS